MNLGLMLSGLAQHFYYLGLGAFVVGRPARYFDNDLVIMGRFAGFVQRHVKIVIDLAVVGHHKGKAGRENNASHQLVFGAFYNPDYPSFGALAVAGGGHFHLHNIAIHSQAQVVGAYPNIALFTIGNHVGKPRVDVVHPAGEHLGLAGALIAVSYLLYLSGLVQALQQRNDGRLGGLVANAEPLDDLLGRVGLVEVLV